VALNLVRRAASVAALLGALAPVLAQQPVVLPADVETVVTGGRWRSGANEGTYRVVVRSGGFEHVVSQVQVDWVSNPTDQDKPQVVVASEIASTGSWRVGRARIVQRGKQWVAILEGVEPHFTPLQRGTWEVSMGSPGKLNAVLRAP
jgi:hypothetical protein